MDGSRGTKDCPQCRVLERQLRAQGGLAEQWQHEVLALRRQVAQLERQAAQQQEQLERLRAQLEQAERDAKRQSVRFPRRTRVANPKRPGRKPGLSYGAQRRRAEPQQVDRTIAVTVDRQCPDCGAALDIHTHAQYQTDLPPVRPTVTRFQIEVGVCSRCGKRVQGRHREQTSDALAAANHVLGPNVHALAASLKHGAGMAYGKISRFFAESFGLQVSAATWARAGVRLASKAQATVTRLRTHLVRSEWMHADETGWRVGVEGTWLWVFASETITLYAIADSRGHAVPERMLEGFQGVLCCDGLAVYDCLDVIRLRCNAHVLRRMAALEETLGAADRATLQEIKHLFQEAAQLKERRAVLTRVGYQRHLNDLEQRFDQWLWCHELLKPLQLRDPALVRLGNHLARHREAWWLYLYNPALPTTNNLAERQLRPGVISRKLGGCNRTWTGAVKTATLNSLVATCRQQRRSFQALIARLLHARAPTAVPLGTLPALA